MEYVSLLDPANLYDHYRHQLRQTISAYSPAMIVLGEALQNAIDAIVETDDVSAHEVRIDFNLDQRSVTVSDTGVGFRNDPTLLFLGGGTKRRGDTRLFGLVGVGLKVVLFSSMEFCLRANSNDGVFRYEIIDAYRFENDPPPILQVPHRFPDDQTPLKRGTEVYYRFPRDVAHDPVQRFMQDMYDHCLPQGSDSGYGKTLKSAVKRGVYKNRFAALMASFLRRFTYAGDVRNSLGMKDELSNTSIRIQVTCSNPTADFGKGIGELFDGETKFSFKISPEYLLVKDTRDWVFQQDRPGLYGEALGRGGTNLTRTLKGFNVLRYTADEDYEKLLTDRNGNIPNVVKESLNEYQDRLFPRINGIILTIGRIPLLEEFLPGGSQRVISANGVVTTHEVDLTRGRNQEYVRCFDMVVDVNASLNYGKSHLADSHLVSRIRRFVNDAYATTIQTAANNWVGKVSLPEEEEQYDFFLKREDLGIPELSSKKIPRDENDVIALFFEMLGKGYINGYQSFGLSQIETYDGRFLLKRNGDQTDPEIPADDRQLSAVEFKIAASSLIRDFEREVKDPRELKLVVAWEEGRSTSDQFGFADIQHSRHFPERVYNEVTRYLENTKTGSQIQVLLLNSLIEGLRHT